MLVDDDDIRRERERMPCRVRPLILLSPSTISSLLGVRETIHILLSLPLFSISSTTSRHRLQLHRLINTNTTTPKCGNIKNVHAYQAGFTLPFNSITARQLRQSYPLLYARCSRTFSILLCQQRFGPGSRFNSARPDSMLCLFSLLPLLSFLSRLDDSFLPNKTTKTTLYFY